MRHLYIVRHAKSSWGNIDLQDFDRPLNERGKKDAPEMARRLLERDIKMDAFVSSPAKRAKKTAGIFCDELGGNKKHIILVESLYHASDEIFYDVIQSFDDDYKHVAVFSHNPCITDFVNLLCPAVKIQNMPTCGIFAVAIPIKKWIDFKEAEKKFLFFDYPKNN